MLVPRLTGRFGPGVLSMMTVLALAACGGGGSTTAATRTSIETLPSGKSLPTVTYDSTNDSISLSNGTNLTRDTKVDLGDFHAYTDGSNSFYWRDASASGALWAGFGSVTDNGSQVAGVEFHRNGYANIPSSGTASYSGAYGGIITDQNGNLNGNGAVSGSVALQADFGAATVNGSITNRNFYGNADTSTPTATLGDLSLSGGAIDGNGFFKGTATGGAATTFTDTTSQGIFTGEFGGATGNEAVGAVQINHTTSAGTFVETGAFVAKQ